MTSYTDEEKQRINRIRARADRKVAFNTASSAQAKRAKFKLIQLGKGGHGKTMTQAMTEAHAFA